VLHTAVHTPTWPIISLSPRPVSRQRAHMYRSSGRLYRSATARSRRPPAGAFKDCGPNGNASTANSLHRHHHLAHLHHLHVPSVVAAVTASSAGDGFSTLATEPALCCAPLAPLSGVRTLDTGLPLCSAIAARLVDVPTSEPITNLRVLGVTCREKTQQCVKNLLLDFASCLNARSRQWSILEPLHVVTTGVCSGREQE
jgi:hypothetical protein